VFSREVTQRAIQGLRMIGEERSSRSALQVAISANMRSLMPDGGRRLHGAGRTETVNAEKGVGELVI
jgi:hypothetical protein